MTARLPGLRPDALDAEQRRLYDDIVQGPRSRGPHSLTDEDGALRGPFNAFLLSPEVGQAVQRLGAAVRFHTALSPREREMAILVVAVHWQSAHEIESHQAIARTVGVTEPEIEALLAGTLPSLGDERERVCLEAARAMVAGDVGDDLWQRAEAVLGRQLVFELTTLVGYYATLALQMRVFRVT